MIEKLTLFENEIDDGCGFVHQRSVKETYPVHTHDFFELFYIINGKAIHNINNDKRLIQGGDLVFIRPNDVHSYEFFNSFDFEIISLGCPRDEMYKAFEYVGLNDKQFTDCDFPPSISLYGYNKSDIYRKLMHINDKPHGMERKIYFRSILAFILYRFTVFEDIQRSSIPDYLTKIVEEMSEKENFAEGLSKMLKISHITQEHLTREFRKHLNLSPTEFINLKRLDYAAQLLSENKYTITEVCFMCGFNSLSHFYHSFKKQYGCTPKQFSANYNVDI